MDETTDPTWEDVAVDPFAGSYRQGQENGRIAGQEAGYREGYALGRTTALNYGLEWGYIHGFLAELRHFLSTSQATTRGGEVAAINTSRMERIQRSIDNLMVALDEFPPTAASEMLVVGSRGADRNSDNAIREVTGGAGSTLDGEYELVDDGVEVPASDDDMDVEAKMQRIRARFKLLCVQIDPHHAKLLQLSVVLDDTSAVGDASLTAADVVVVANSQDSHAW
jgi:hypothetical protein